jgi:hypothetical protein
MKDFVLVRQVLGLFHTRIGRLDKDGEAIKEDREPKTQIAISSIVEHGCTMSNTAESLKASFALQVRGQYHVLLSNTLRAKSSCRTLSLREAAVLLDFFKTESTPWGDICRMHRRSAFS